VRAEADRIRKEIDKKTLELGSKVLELAAAHKAVDPSLQPLIDQIRELNDLLEDKRVQLEAINAEAWVPPPPPPPPPPTASPPPSSPTPSSAPATPPPTAAASPTQSAQPTGEDGTALCPNCRSRVTPVAGHCPMCGFKIPI
jgi:hypothetical protein